jgi:hypothetical protein
MRRRCHSEPASFLADEESLFTERSSFSCRGPRFVDGFAERDVGAPAAAGVRSPSAQHVEAADRVTQGGAQEYIRGKMGLQRNP